MFRDNHKSTANAIIRVVLSIFMAMCIFFSCPLRCRAQGSSIEEVKSWGKAPEIVMDVSFDQACQMAVDHLNTTYRASVGAKPLVLDPGLCVLAQRRAIEVSRLMGHFCSDGTNSYYALCDAVEDWDCEAAENLVVTNTNLDNMMDLRDLGRPHEQTISHNAIETFDWYTTSVEGHYEIMIDDVFTRCGIGCYYDPEYHLLYWAHLFAGEGDTTSAASSTDPVSTSAHRLLPGIAALIPKP